MFVLLKLSQKEVAALAERLSNWNKLHADLKQREAEMKPEAFLVEVMRLITAETLTRRRTALAMRLLGIYHRAQRAWQTRLLTLALGGK